MHEATGIVAVPRHDGVAWPAAPAWRQDGGAWQQRGADAWACALGLGLPVPVARLRCRWQDREGNTWLHYWAQAPSANADWALAQTERAMLTPNARGETPWAWLLRRGAAETIDAWRRMRREWPRPCDGTWLMESAWSGHGGILAEMGDASGWASDVVDAQGATALMVASHRHDAASMATWLAQAPEVCAADRQGRTLVHHLAAHGDLDNMLCAESLGADLAAADAHGDSAMDILHRCTPSQSAALRAHWAGRWQTLLRF